LPGIVLFLGDGWICAGYVFVWQIALFLSLGKNFLAYGGALAVAALVGALGGLLLGRHIDAGHGKRAVWLSLGVYSVIVILRAIAVGNAAVAVLANALSALGACLYIPTLMTIVYTRSKSAPCTLRFQVAAEGGWDIGGASGLLLAALLTAYHVPLGGSILLSLLGVAAMFVMLGHYYNIDAKRERSYSEPSPAG
jgi:MFS family permease